MPNLNVGEEELPQKRPWIVPDDDPRLMDAGTSGTSGTSGTFAAMPYDEFIARILASQTSAN